MSLSGAAAMARNQNWGMAGVEVTPELAFVEIYRRVTPDSITLEQTLGRDLPPWRLTVDETEWYIHRAKDALRLTHIGRNPSRRVYEQYTTDEFAPDPGDTVVDVGAFIGEFSQQVAAEHDVDVVAVEPDPRNMACLERNAPRARIEHCGAWNERDALEFQIASDGSETGLLQPDKGDATPQVVPTKRLDGMVEACDFAKIEAEGLEPEVLEGMTDIRPQRVVVNVSPERDGEAPVAACRQILEKRGYNCRHDGDELYATHKQ